jgi:hypothetical protein
MHNQARRPKCLDWPDIPNKTLAKVTGELGLLSSAMAKISRNSSSTLRESPPRTWTRTSLAASNRLTGARYRGESGRSLIPARSRSAGKHWNARRNLHFTWELPLPTNASPKESQYATEIPRSNENRLGMCQIYQLRMLLTVRDEDISKKSSAVI